jgi:peptidylprolyl isomerase
MRRAAALAAPLATLLAAGVLAGCGGDSSGDVGEPSGTQEPKAAQTAAPEAGDPKDLSVKPQVGKPTGDPPTELVKRDIVKGKGKRAKDGDDVTVDYVGVSWSTGEQFDASWDSGQPFSFTLGAGQVIPGWDQGVAGMRAGGRRELIIPPDLAYGPQGRPPVIAQNETLIFIVDLKKIG